MLWFGLTQWRCETTGGQAFWLAVALCAGSLSWSVRADESKSKSNKPAAKPQTNKTALPKTATENKPAVVEQAIAVEALSSDRVAAAVTFARQHHPELAELLSRLQASYPDQYAKAIRELDKTRERLERNREKDTDRYSILLREWQLDSRVRLLAARLMMGGTPELETELRQLLADRHGVRLQLLTYDREKSKTRLQKMDEQIAEHVQNREASIDREFDRIKKSAEMRKKPVAKPASKRPGDKDK